MIHPLFLTEAMKTVTSDETHSLGGSVCCSKMRAQNTFSCISDECGDGTNNNYDINNNNNLTTFEIIK